jgi:hypothetical protein
MSAELVRAGDPGDTTAQPTWRTFLPPFLLLAAVVGIARYWHLAQFGFYEDDYTLVTRGMASSWPEAWAFSRDLLFGFGGQGRPLQQALLYLLSFLAGRLGGLPEAYGLGYAIVAGNSMLAYTVLRRLGDARFALVGALGYALFPADTTPLFLYHAFGLQQALTWFWLAAHAYLSDRRVLAYVLILGSLLSYETVFPVFLAAPLLRGDWDRRLIRRTVAHAGILATLFGAVLVLRALVGEARVAGLGFPGVVTTPLLHMIEGPAVSMGTFFYRPIQALLAADREIALVLLVAAVLFGLLLFRLRPVSSVRPASLWAGMRRRPRFRAWPPEMQRMARLALTGLLMLILAYPLTFTIRAYAISGRDTRVHFAAILGASILWGAFAWLFLALAEGIRKRWLAAGLLAVILGGLAGFGFVIQRDYARSWELQRSFWTQVVALCPDLEEGTVILVAPEAFTDTRQIAANHWNLPRVLDQLYSFPSGWEDPPRLYRLVPGWEEHIVAGDGRLRLDAQTVLAPPSLYGEVESPRVIYLSAAGGLLVRETSPLQVAGIDFPIKSLPSAAPAGPDPGPLYRYLVDGPEARSQSGILRSAAPG